MDTFWGDTLGKREGDPSDLNDRSGCLKSQSRQPPHIAGDCLWRWGDFLTTLSIKVDWWIMTTRRL